jgi:hypothetical protein
MKIQSLAQLITVGRFLPVLAVTNIKTESMTMVLHNLRVFTCADKHGLSFWNCVLLLLLLLFILTANGFVPGGSGTTIRHTTQNNTPHSNKTQHTKLQKQ